MVDEERAVKCDKQTSIEWYAQENIKQTINSHQKKPFLSHHLATLASNSSLPILLLPRRLIRIKPIPLRRSLRVPKMSLRTSLSLRLLMLIMVYVTRLMIPIRESLVHLMLLLDIQRS